MKKVFDDILQYVSSVFFPNRCIFCGELIDPFDIYCEHCADTVPFIKGEICCHCGAEKKDCRCRKKAHYYDAVAAPLYYEDVVKNCIHRYKFRDERNLSKSLAILMADTLKERFPDVKFDYITYIPMIKRKQRARGFNQSGLLAREISKLTDIPLADGMLVKLYDTDCQHECTAIERTGNLIGAFDVDAKFDLRDKTVLLTDDIKTSGATLNECSKMLYLSGARSVICLTSAVRNSKI